MPKPLHLLSDSAIEMMAKDFERPAWKKTEQDSIFAERSARQLRTEQARRRAARKVFTGEPLTDAEQTAWSNACLDQREAPSRQ